MMHLTNESLRRLLSGTADPAEARALAAHLAQDCPDCEELLAAQPAGPLDGHADRALTALAPPRPEESGHDLEFARIQRALRTAAPARRPRALRRWAPLAAAAGMLLAVGIGVEVNSLRTRQDGWDGLKGVATTAPLAVPVRLSAVAVLPDSRGEPQVWKVGNGDSLPREAALELRIEVSGAADVAIARVGRDGSVDAFWHQRVGSAGTVQITVDGRPAAYPLSALAGPQRFIVVASPAGLAPERIAAAARALAPPAAITSGSPPLEGLTTDVLGVTVR